MKSLLWTAIALVVALPLAAAPAKEAEPAWVKPMLKVRAAHPNKDVYVAQLGDSITYSMAFWSVLAWHDVSRYLPDNDGLPKAPDGKRWQDVIAGVKDKGSEHGNYSGWRTGDVLKAIDGVLAKKKPAIAIIMIGTNDIAGGKVPANYRKDLETIVGKCIQAGCVPILNTIPPRKGLDETVAAANKIIRDVAERASVPLADYHEQIMKRRPDGTWNGTLISADGVHPSGGKNEVMTEENLKESGYALRTWVNFLAVREVYFRVIKPAPK